MPRIRDVRDGVLTRASAEDGYAMAALLVALIVMSVMASVAMPVWKQFNQREQETELIFRGEQYARAIGLFQRKTGPGTLPPNVDLLVEQRFLRKKYKDPITNGDFQILAAGQSIPGSGPATAAPGAPGAPGRPSTGTPPAAARPGTPFSPGTTGAPGAPGAVGMAGAGVMGVVSKSTGTSIRLYNARSKYNEWAFVYVAQTQTPGGPGGPAGAGNPGGAPGSRVPGGAPGMPQAPPGGLRPQAPTPPTRPRL